MSTHSVFTFAFREFICLNCRLTFVPSYFFIAPCPTLSGLTRSRLQAPTSLYPPPLHFTSCSYLNLTCLSRKLQLQSCGRSRFFLCSAHGSFLWLFHEADRMASQCLKMLCEIENNVCAGRDIYQRWITDRSRIQYSGSNVCRSSWSAKMIREQQYCFDMKWFQLKDTAELLK